MSNIGRKKKQREEKSPSVKKYPSIFDMPQKQSIDGTQYEWRKIYGLSDMLSWLDGRVKVAEVDVKNADAASSGNRRMWSWYGDNLRYISEAFVFDDGAALACCTISTWGGTFASHDEISTAYFALEKK